MEFELTPSQLRAVDLNLIQQDTCIVAGPGSGKTAVLVECYRRLVMNAGISPTRLLAITFTERAARSMKQKLAAAFAGNPDLLRQLEQANVSTVHGFCARLLRQNAIFAGVDPQFGILEARDATRFQSDAVTETLDALFARDPEPMRALMGSLASPNLASGVLELYDAIRCAGVEIEKLGDYQPRGVVTLGELQAALRKLASANPIGWTPIQRGSLRDALESGTAILSLDEDSVTLEHAKAINAFKHKGQTRKDEIGNLLRRVKMELVPAVHRSIISQFYAPERETILRILADFGSHYSQRKVQSGKLDFSDLETHTVRLLEEHPELRQRIQGDFDHILMDEFQDTNGQQARLLELLRPPDRFYAVGDINQSIYGFRHANPDVFRRYRDEVLEQGKHLVDLQENWRSRPAILNAVQTILRDARGIEPHELIPRRKLPEKTQPSVEVIAAISPDVDDALQIEAAWIARRIRELQGHLQLASGPAAFADIAVLIRNLEVVPELTRAFDDANIPYLINQGKGFFETREVLDLTHLLRVLDNPLDEISLVALLRSPFAAVSDEAILRLKLQGNIAGSLRRFEHIDSGAFHPEDREKVSRLREQLVRWRTHRDAVGFDRLLATVMEETGYPWEPGTRAGANIEKFLALARSASPLSLSRFIEDLEGFRDADPREPDPPPEDAEDSVRIMTIHAAKGLEFPVVFMAALHKGVRDKLEHLAFSPNAGVGVRWCDPETRDHEDDWFQYAIRQERDSQDEHESNRLLYVAMTRAEEHLVLSLSTPKEWGKTVAESFGLDLSIPQDSIEEIRAPNGEPFEVRVFATGSKPERIVESVEITSAPPARLVAKPSRSDQHDSAATVTDVSLFAECPRRYYLSRYLRLEGNRRARFAPWTEDGFEEVDADALDASELGIEVHRLLAGATIENASVESQKLAGAFHVSALGKRAARATRVEREWDFLMAFEDVVLRGQIDLWFEEGGELVLVDYKTDQVDAAVTATRAAVYAPQLRLYAMALERSLGRLPGKAYVYFLRPDQAVPIDLRVTLFDDPGALVREFREAQSSLEFPLREAEHCKRCSFFRGLCPAGTEASGMSDIVHPAAIDGENLGGDEASLG